MSTYNLYGIYNWSLKLTQEQQDLGWIYYYVWTKPAETLLKILQQQGNNLIILKGEQGQGKTATLYALTMKLDDAIYTKWNKHESPKIIKNEENQRKIKTILIDLPDYPYNDTKTIKRNLNEIHQYWTQEAHRKNIVITQQSEQPDIHFFQGKTTLIQLEPIPPQKMIDAILAHNIQYQKITGPAFHRLAQHSQGNFRNLQKYIRLILEAYPDAELYSITPIMIDTIIITPAVTAPDRHKSLMKIFTHQPTRETATRILDYLTTHPPTNQKTIARALNASENMVSRIVNKLSYHGLVVKTRGNRKENLISLP